MQIVLHHPWMRTQYWGLGGTLGGGTQWGEPKPKQQQCSWVGNAPNEEVTKGEIDAMVRIWQRGSGKESTKPIFVLFHFTIRLLRVFIDKIRLACNSIKYWNIKNAWVWENEKTRKNNRLTWNISLTRKSIEIRKIENYFPTVWNNHIETMHHREIFTGNIQKLWAWHKTGDFWNRIE